MYPAVVAAAPEELSTGTCVSVGAGTAILVTVVGTYEYGVDAFGIGVFVSILSGFAGIGAGVEAAATRFVRVADDHPNSAHPS